ncbi:MAG TPA: HD-GYP domain-containing protein [Chloroflexota bacterium]|nr:HD-GYP domain-containing protein [Chloroflexota bacterium]
MTFGTRFLRGRHMSLLQRFALISLLTFTLLGVGITYVLTQSIQSSALAEARQSAYDNLHDQLLRELTPADLTRTMTGARYRRFDRFVHDGILSDRTVRVKIWSLRGQVLFSDDKRAVGRSFPIDDKLSDALHGILASDVSDLTDAENQGERARFHRLLEVYIPIRFRPGGPVRGAFEIYQVFGPVANQIAMLQRRVIATTIAGLLLLYLLLFWIVRQGSNTIVRQRKQLERYTAELEDSYNQTILSLAAAVDARDASTEQHAERVTALAKSFGSYLSLPRVAMKDLERGALLHDVGKIGVRDAILRKPGRLSEDEWAEMRQHPEIGYRMLANVPFLANAMEIVGYHHERWDGTGYPAGLKGKEIPLVARLFAIVDVYDALTSDRPYRAAMTREVALALMQRDAGTHFDPELLAAFEQMMSSRGVLSVDSVKYDMPARIRGERIAI